MSRDVERRIIGGKSTVVPAAPVPAETPSAPADEPRPRRDTNEIFDPALHGVEIKKRK